MPAAGLVTETLAYDGGRQVTVYVPPDPPEAVVFAGDGQGISRWGGFLEAASVPSTMIVGVHGLADEMSRLHEYSPVFDAERFAAHEKFFVQDVRRWVREPVGGRAARCRCGRRDERAGRVARHRAVARRVPADGGVGVRTRIANDVAGLVIHRCAACGFVRP